MAKHRDRQNPEASKTPNEPPLDDIADIVEFVDEIPGPADEPSGFTFEDLPSDPEPGAVPPAPRAGRRKENESVMDDDFVSVDEGSGALSGVISSAARLDSGSAVLPQSEVIRAEPLSDSVPLEPVSEIVEIVPRADPATIDDFDIVEDAVLDDESVEVMSDVVAMPDSAVQAEAILSDDEDVVDVVDIDADEPVKSAGSRKTPEKEPVLDLDDTMLGLDSPPPKNVKPVEPTVAFFGGSSEDIDIHDLVADAEIADGSSVDLGGKPSRDEEQSGIDPLAEELESGVRLDAAAAAPARRPASPPSVEFDELIVDDDVAAVDPWADEPSEPRRKSAQLPGSSLDEAPLAIDDEGNEIGQAAAAHDPAFAGGSDDDIDIEAMLGNEPVEVGAGFEDADALAVEDAPLEVDEAPVTTPKRGKQTAEAASSSEPKKRGGWGSLLGGAVLGSLLTAGAGAGVWYTAPELITGMAPMVMPPIVKSDIKANAKSALQSARDAMDQGEFAEAVDELKEAKDDKPALALRGEARWLGYFQKKRTEKAPLNSDDEEVKLALDDLKQADSQLKIEQIQSALQSGALKAEIEQAKKSEEALKVDLTNAAKEKDDADKLVQGVAKVLADAKLLAEGEKLDAQKLQAIAKQASEAKDLLAGVDKSLQDANIDGAGAIGVEKLVAAKKEVEIKLAEANKALASAGGKDASAKSLMEALASRDKAVKEKDDADKLVQGVAKILADAKLLAEGDKLDAEKLQMIAKEAGEAKGLLTDVDKALKDANIDGAGAAGVEKLAAAKREIEIKLAEANKALVTGNGKEAIAKTLMDAQASRDKLASELMELAKTVDAAYKELAEAKLVAPGGDPRKDLLAAAKAARTRAEMPVVGPATVPPANAAHTPTPEQQLDRLAAVLSHRSEKNADLIADANRLAQWVLSPDSQSSADAKAKALYVQGLALREQAKGQMDEKTRAAIQSDAETAAKDPKTASAGHFVLGRLEEQAGNLPKAEEFFRQALKAATPDDEQADQIRLRLGRLLLRDRPAAAAPPVAPPPPAPPAEPKKEEEKQPEKEPADAPPKVSFVHPLSGLVAALALTQPPTPAEALTPEAQARIQEIIELGRKLLESKDKNIQAQGHFLLGEALGRQGQRPEALRHYVSGLELLHPEVQLSKLLEETPTYPAPDTFQRANPLLAEKHYGIGLHLFHARKLSEAEEQFQQATSHFDKDARYFYFLGLAQNDQGKRDAAIAAWEQASRLEANGRPNTREINMALERIQGDRRFLLNGYRGKAVAAP